MDNQEKQEPTITLTLTTAEAAALLNGAAFAVSLLMAGDGSAAASGMRDAVDAFESLGAKNYEALAVRITDLVAAADPNTYEPRVYDRVTGEDKPLTTEAAA